MEASGSRRIRAPLAAVVGKLGDAATLAACIPKCESVTGNRKDGFQFVISHRFGPINTVVRGRITLTEELPDSRYAVQVDGSIGIVGRVKGNAIVTLQQMPKATVLTYTAQSQLSGWKALLGGAKIDSLFARGAGIFFDRFVVQVEGGKRPAVRPQA